MPCPAHCSHVGIRTRAAFALYRALLVAALAALFWIPAARWTWPHFPAPLDDVYIYFDFARSTARGCVLCWTEGGGYSSGATSPLYALLLSVGWGVGFRGALLGWFAAALTLGALFDLTGSVVAVAGRHPGAKAAAALLVLGVPLLAWTLVSGMETAFVAAICARTLVAVERTFRAPPHLRDGAQRVAGAWLAITVLGRPELVALAAALTIAIGHGAGSRPLLSSLCRAGLPWLVALGGFALVNFAFTGEASASGAIRKLVTHDPYATASDTALLVLTNVLRLYTIGFEIALGGPWAARGLFAIAFVSCVVRKTRRLGVCLVLGAIGALLLVSLNKTAPYQNLRYVAPSLLLVLVAASLGLRALFSRSAVVGWAGAAIVLAIVGSASRELPLQRRHFATSARNIREQQVAVGERLASMVPRPRKVFVGDAGAMPYVADLPALDGLGLGGTRDLPFARASVHGVGAVLELIERMPPADRPDVLAIYASWWPELAAHFGTKTFSIRIEDNVMCADPEKTVFVADWSLLQDRGELEAGAVFRIDVADLVDEAANDVAFTKPRGGYVTTAILLDDSGKKTFDAERLLAKGQSLRLRLPARSFNALTLDITSSSASSTEVRLERAGAPIVARIAPRPADTWGRATLDIEQTSPEEVVTIVAADAPLKIAAITARER